MHTSNKCSRSENTRNNSIIKLAITIISVFILMTAGTGTVFAADEVLDQASGGETTLKLCRGKSADSAAFHMTNMLPGDSETHSYSVNISYKGTLTLNFNAEVREGYGKLAEVLKCKVSLRSGEVLYEGLMKDIPQSIPYQLPDSSGGTTGVIYDITAYLDTSVGNEYMNQELYADFNWWVDADDSESGGADSDIPGEDGGTGGTLINPRTGDNSNILPWAAAATGALILVIILLLARRRKEA